MNGEVTITVENSETGQIYRLARPFPWEVLQTINGTGGTISFNPLSFTEIGNFDRLILDNGFNSLLDFTIVVSLNPIAPSLTKSPAEESICAGENISAKITEGVNGLESCADTYEYSIDGGKSWNAYVSDQIINTNELSGPDVVRIQAYRSDPDGGGCMSAVNEVRWTVNAPADPDVTGEASPCINSTSEFATESGMTNYIWNVINGTIISGGTQNDNNVYVSWNQNPGPGSVHVNYTDGNGCTSNTSTYNINVKSLPVPSINGPDLACVSNTQIYTTEDAMSGYLWSVTGGTGSSTSNSISITWGAEGDGKITVNYIDENGCSAASVTEKYLVINPLPVPTISGPNSACANSVHTYTTESGFDNYDWSVIGGTGIPNGNSVEVTWDNNPEGTHFIAVNYSSNGCRAANYTEYPVTITGRVQNIISGIWYCAIQDAIDDASADETIEVYSGIYNENIIVGVEGITLKNATSEIPVIQPSNGIAVMVAANNVTVNGFSITHNVLDDPYDVGLYIQLKNHATIRNNLFTSNSCAIALVDAGDNTIQDNTFNANGLGIFIDGNTDGLGHTDGGSNGPFYSLALNNQITGNTIQNCVILPFSFDDNGVAIYVDAACENNVLENNQILNNAASGYYAWKASNNSLTNNNFSGNGVEGIQLMGSSGNTITGNTLDGNKIAGHASYGINIRCGALSSTTNVITGNTIIGNVTGIRLQDDFTTNNYSGVVSGNTISNNKIYGNTWGIFTENTPPNTIYAAENNWWGDASGPKSIPSNACGLGNEVSSNVDFMPWWTTETGGAGTLAIHNTTKDTYYCTIQGAINDANAGEVIEVAEGIYTYETEGNPVPSGLIKVTKGITLKAAPGARPIIDGSGFDGVFKIHPSALSPGNTVIIEGFNILGNASTGIAMTMQGCFNETAAHIIIRDNWFHGMVGGIDFWGATSFLPDGWTSAVANTEIKGNKFYNMVAADGHQGFGVLIESPADWATAENAHAVKIENNEFSNMASDGSNYGTGIGIMSMQGAAIDANVSISGNNFTSDVPIGLALANADVIHTEVTGNSFENGVFGISVSALTNEPLTAPCNWFGTVVPAEVSTLISGDVNYTPWLTDGTDASSGIVGFQPAVSCDETAPLAGQLTMITNQHTSPGIQISASINGMYEITTPLSFNGVDVFQSLSVVVTDDNLNTQSIQVSINGTQNGEMVYDASAQIWNYENQTIEPEFQDGPQLITATFIDHAGNSTPLILKFITDATAPLITLIGNETLSICQGSEYQDDGATALDNLAGDLTSIIITAGANIDTDVPGIYIISYNITDNAGNPADERIRSVQVKPNPILSGLTTSATSPVCYGTAISFMANGLLDGINEFTYTITGTGPGLPINNAIATANVTGGSFTFPAPAHPYAPGEYLVTINSITVDDCTTELIEKNTVSFTVNPLPTASISGELTACTSTILTAVSDAVSPSFVWYKEAEIIIGQEASALTVTESGDYQLKVIDGISNCSQISEVVSVIIYPETFAGAVTGGTSVCSGSTSNELSLGTHTGDVVRWESSVNPFTTWTPIANTEDTYTSGALTEITQFRAVVQSGVYSELPSSATTVSVFSTEIISGNCPSCNSPLVICEGGNPNTFGITTSNSGGDGSYTYQWEESANGSETWVTAIAQDEGATNYITFNPPILNAPITSMRYRLKITDGCGNVGYSAIKTYTVIPDPIPPTIYATPESGHVICVGNRVSATFDAGSGGTGTIGDKYEFSTNNGTTWSSYTSGAEIIATAATIGVNTIRIRSYRDASGTGCTKIYNTAQWSVNPLPLVYLVGGGGFYCFEGTGVSITLSNSSVGFTYELWLNGSATGIKLGGTGSSLSFNNVKTAGTYNIIATDDVYGCINMMSGVSEVQVRPEFTAGNIETSGEEIPYLGNPGVIGSILPASGGDGTITYKWQSSIDGINFTDIPNSDAETFNPTSLMQSTWFKRMAKDGTCNPFTSSEGIWEVTISETAALTWIRENTSLSSVSGSITDLTATFPASIPPVIVADPYKINSRMTLSGDAIPEGSTMDILVTVNGTGPVSYVTGAPIPSGTFWITDLKGETPSDFDQDYAGKIELYCVTIHGGGGNPLAHTGKVKIESIVSKDGFTTNAVLDDISLDWIVPDAEALPLDVTGFTANSEIMHGNLADGYILDTDNNPATSYLLQFASGSKASEPMKDEVAGLFLISTAGQTDELIAYYIDKDPLYKPYLNGAAAGVLPFAYIKTGGTDIRILDGAQYTLNSQAEVDLIVPDNFPLGTYTVTGTVHDLAENSIQVTYILNVTGDRIKPVITLIGDASIAICQGETYNDAGATATDDVDGDISSRIIVGNHVDKDIPDTYIVTYNVSDAAGNDAIEVKRTVVVKPNPTISGVTVSDVSACFGSSVDFTINGLLNGPTDFVYSIAFNGETPVETWSNGTTVVNGSATFSVNNPVVGTYAIKIISATVNSCTTTFQYNNTVSFTVHPIPAAPTVTVVDNHNGTSTLTVSDYEGTLLWSNTETLNPITVNTGGIYTVTQTVNGCTSPASSGFVNPSPTTFVLAPIQETCGVYKVDVTVQDFINIGSISLKLNFDPLVIEYLSAEMNSEMADALYDGNNTTGQFSLSYMGVGIDLPDDAVLCTLHLEVKAGVPEATTPLSWSKVAAACEYAGASGIPVYISSFVDNTISVSNCAISGKLVYNNLSQTPMNKVELTLSPVNAKLRTNDDGSFSFTGLHDGTYTISVTDNRKEVGYINSTDAGAANSWTTAGGAIDYVKFLSGDVANNDKYINATDAQRIQKFFVNATPFDKDPWCFWKKGDMISDNYGTKYENFDVIVAGANVVGFDVFGMCTGDFNGSFTPTILKSTNSSLMLTSVNNIQVGHNQEFELPIRAESSLEIGAISMILHIPSYLLKVQDVLVNGSTVLADWAQKGDELRIGWYSSNPVNIAENNPLLTLKLMTTDAFVNGESVEVSLKSDPLNELADANFSIIHGALLHVAQVANLTTGIIDKLGNKPLSIRNYPNPFRNSTTIDYELPVNGKVTIVIYNQLQQEVITLLDAEQTAGQYTISLDSKYLNPGIYIAKLKLTNKNVDSFGTVKLSVLK
ncbi:MAG: immunoglobulin-like domain-containing protein [Prolixibacteraceae bacterium]